MYGKEQTTSMFTLVETGEYIAVFDYDGEFLCQVSHGGQPIGCSEWLMTKLATTARYMRRGASFHTAFSAARRWYGTTGEPETRPFVERIGDPHKL